MTAPRIDTVQSWQDRTMVDPAGGKIGTIVDIYLDDDTGQPEWATVTTGLFGSKQNFVPLAQAQAMGDSVQVPYDKDRVKSAPAIPAEGQLSQDEEVMLYRYYGLDYTESRSESGLPAGTAEQNFAPRDRYDQAPEGAVGRDLSGPTTDDAMTRSEEGCGSAPPSGSGAGCGCAST
jgi:PRC-barrel domain